MAEHQPVEATASVEMPANRARTLLIFGAISVFAAMVFGLLYLFVIAPAAPGSSLGWFLFSFATGITMIIMPCTLPLAFVIVPLSMGKGLVKGISMALAFGLGITITQSLYGVAAAVLGKLAIGALGADLEVVKNWVYLVAGIFALVFALSEIGLMKFRMPTYTGAAPAFIQQRRDAFKAFLLGLFLGNIGIGCPHPATPLLLIEAASSGDVLYGWLLFLVHASGRVLPLLLLAFLAILGVNGLNFLVTKKDAVERATGWAMVFVAGFILTLGLFTHAWWVNSGIHTMLEKVTQESYFNARFNDMLNSAVAHNHGLETGTAMFGLPLWLGNWFLVSVWILPIWWWWFRKRKSLMQSPVFRIQALEGRIDELEKERRQVESMVALDEAEVSFDLKVHEAEIDRLEQIRRAEEEKVHYSEKGVLQSPIAQTYEMKMLYTVRNYLFVLSVFIVLVFAYFLPTNFYLASISGMGGHAHTPVAVSTSTTQALIPFSTDTANLPDATLTQTITLQDGGTYKVSAGYVKRQLGNRVLRMMAYNGSVPGPFIHAPEGSTVNIEFTNNTDIDQTIHSHGVRVDNLSDGVPGVTQVAVKPGETYTYTINFKDVGVYWFHPHTRDDYGQELGLYGNYIVEPSDEKYYSPVNREIPLVIDDILIENERIAPFYKEYTDHALLGRFGNEFLVNGAENFTTNVKMGEVVRFMVTNVSNARTYNLSIPGLKIKLVGSDAGKYERETSVDSLLLSPAERAIVEVYFEKPGVFTLTHTDPSNSVKLATFGVSSEERADVSYAKEFAVMRTDTSATTTYAAIRAMLPALPQKNVLMTVDLGMNAAAMNHGAHAHAMPGMMTSASTSNPSGIQWDDVGNTDTINTTQNVTWKLVDLENNLVNDAINWKFKVGEFVKVRFTNDKMAMHVMQHPIHFHGQRFVVLARNGVPNDNLVWKDTALVLPGETVDLVVDMSNPGLWMAHCHIVEHLHGGMMLNFRVEDPTGYATGDEFRATLPKVVPIPKSTNGMSGMAGMPGMGGMMGTGLSFGMSTSSISFAMVLPENNYTAIPERVFVQMGKKQNVAFELVDRSNTPIQLSKDVPRALSVTFVKSDDRVKLETYIGNTAFDTVAAPAAMPMVPNGAPFDESMPHSHPTSMFPSLIPVASAHGTVNDGHAGVAPLTYTYAVPVVFPEKGVYRAFVQFLPVGGSEIRTVSFNMEVGASGWSVDNYGWSKTKKWWTLLIISLITMLPLIYGVRRYIGNEK